jgi:transcriptional regulator with PAS, ATPase and Fis domain
MTRQSSQLEAAGEVGLVAVDQAMRRVVREAKRLATFDPTTVIIEGETGSGKEVLARYIHLESVRKDHPFVVLDCATIPQNLIESELFGHEKGAFTGAVYSHIGLLEMADKGTLFWDEVANLDLRIQSVLLRFLETHEVVRVGDGGPRRLDVRVIAASNRNLKHLVDTGEFRRDLYYRLHVARLWLPPLRERPADIRPLLMHFLAYWADHHGCPRPEVETQAMAELEAYDWPGNVREVRNLAEWLLIQGTDGKICRDLVHAYLLGPECQEILAKAARYGGFLKDRDFVVEFVRAWSQTNGHVTETAKAVGISKGSASRYSRVLGLC